MTLWRLEVLRLVRTRRWLALAGVYLLFGLVGPVTAAYLADILGAVGGELDGVIIQVPDPTPADGLAQFTSNAGQIGGLVVVVVAAGALAFDAVEEMGVFLRTRVRSTRRILLPRFVVSALAAICAWLLGVAAAWYETSVLIGRVAWQDIVIGATLGAIYLAFVVALVGAVAQWVRGVLAAVMVSLVALLALPLLGVWDPLERWLPTRLASALSALAGDSVAADYLPAAALAVAATCLLALAAEVGARRLES